MTETQAGRLTEGEAVKTVDWRVYKTERGYAFENGDHQLYLIASTGIWVVQGTPGILFYPTLGEAVGHIRYWMKLNTPGSKLELIGVPELGEVIDFVRERGKL